MTTRTVAPITAAEHDAYIDAHPERAVSFLQTPAWGRVKNDWGHESLGWFVDGDLVGVGLVLYKAIPRTRRVFAYLPEGPVIDWQAAADGSDEHGVDTWLAPMVAHLKARKAFLVRMGPPVVTQAWDAPTVKTALADSGLDSLAQVPADDATAAGKSLTVQLVALDWEPPPPGEGFAGGQPRYVFWLPLAGRTEDDVLAGMNQLWRRNIRKADKAGVRVRTGGADDLAAFHRIYLETTQRDGFPPRALSYFQRMYAELSAPSGASARGADRVRLYLAEHEGDLVAATLAVQVNRHYWYSYGASTTAKREVRGSNAVQWQMIRDAMAAGCDVYDLRGITPTLAEDDPHVGLIRFKLGTGGRAVEYLGEWDLPLNRPLAAAFKAYLARRTP